MFQVWACKQVTDLAGTNLNKQIRHGDDHDPYCPSCGICLESCAHVLHCSEVGRVDALHKSIMLISKWMAHIRTDATLGRLIIQYDRGRGELSMVELAGGLDEPYLRFARSQDKIGWRPFMEGMVLKEVLPIQREYATLELRGQEARSWIKGLILKLLEATYRQWLY